MENRQNKRPQSRDKKREKQKRREIEEIEG